MVKENKRVEERLSELEEQVEFLGNKLSEVLTIILKLIDRVEGKK